MATDHQLTLFDLSIYLSGPPPLDINVVSQVEELPKEIDCEQLELDLFPNPPKCYSFRSVKQAA